jgi:DHA1 family bicyclomycin/chloramphenicol resistance-like MFS transporter
LCDRFGRRLPLFIGMGLFAIGSVGCALSTDIMQIVFWRVFQALGAGTARAMIRDLFSRTRAAQRLSTLMIVISAR